MAEAVEIGERALTRVGYGGEDARIIVDQLVDNALCGYKFAGLPRLLAIAGDEGLQRLAFEQLHHAEEAAIRGATEVVEVDEALVREARHGARLAAETRGELGGGAVLGGEDLHGDAAAEVHVLGLVHDARRAAADLAHEPEPRAGQAALFLGRERLLRRGPGLLLDGGLEGAPRGRDEARDMVEVMRRFNTQVALPLMIDSTEVHVLEAALKLSAGRAIINSINFEDGTEKADRILRLARRFGAAVVALSIDEEGQAYSFEKKVAIAKRIRDYAVEVHGLREEDLIFDALTFPLGAGTEDLRDSGINTLNAIREMKRLMPRAKTILGLSNCSFGLSPVARQVVNSVFLHHAVEAGLDMAIVHASKILPLYRLDERGAELARELVFDQRKFEMVEG